VEYDFQTWIFGIATPWRRNKTLSDLTEKWKKKEKMGCPIAMGDVVFQKKIRKMRRKVRKNERKPN